MSVLPFPVTKIRFRRGTALEWIRENPVLDVGEPGYETNTKKLKLGDGTSRWNALPYLSSEGGEVEAPAMVYTQLDPLATWTIGHDLGRMPAVTVYVGGEIVEPDVIASPEQVVIAWPNPTAGLAVLN